MGMRSTREVFDAAVVGGGVMGAAAVEALAGRGLSVMLVERFAEGHDRGSSHGDGRIFRFAYPEPIYLEMARRAGEGWSRLAREAGEPLVLACGNWDCGPADCSQLAELEENLRSHGVPVERLTARESNRRFPQLHLEAGSEALHQADGGVVLADRAVRALWQLARRAGAEALSGDPVEGIDAGDGGLRLTTAGGRHLSARRAVIAAGGWSRRLLSSLGLELPLTVSREQVAYFRARDGVDHGAGAMPTFIDYHLQDDKPFYGLPRIRVPGVKIGWHHAGLPLEDPEERPPVDEANLQVLRERVRRRLPHLESEPFEVVQCLYTNTPDYHFILDRHPELPGVAIGTGFSGHGFKFAPAVGEILAALALDEEPPVPVETFSLARLRHPERLQPRTGV